MASSACSCPDASMNMTCDTGADGVVYTALLFLLLAIAVWSQCVCDWGSDDGSFDDEVPEGMFS